VVTHPLQVGSFRPELQEGKKAVVVLAVVQCGDRQGAGILEAYGPLSGFLGPVQTGYQNIQQEGNHRDDNQQLN
jgi:hypothetical protein